MRKRYFPTVILPTGYYHAGSYSSAFLTAGFLPRFFVPAVFALAVFLRVLVFFVFSAATPFSASISEAVVTFFLRPTRFGAAFVQAGSEQKYFTFPFPSTRSSNCFPQTGQGFSVGLSQEVNSQTG